MSGGRFEYKQHVILEIIEELSRYLEQDDGEFDYIEDKDRLKSEIRKAIRYLYKAGVYTTRLDWLLSGDDGEESFYARLEEDLKGIE